MSVYYGVMIVSYKTAAIKRAIESSDLHGVGTHPENYRVERTYFGEDEAEAMAAFYRAALKAMNIPLAFSVQVWEDTKISIRVVVEH